MGYSDNCSTNRRQKLCYLKLETHLSTHRSTPQIALACRCGQHKRPEAYSEHAHALHGPDLIAVGTLSEHCFVHAQCGQVCRRFCCLSGEQAYFMLL